jgi:hypothetical protein
MKFHLPRPGPAEGKSKNAATKETHKQKQKH